MRSDELNELLRMGSMKQLESKRITVVGCRQVLEKLSREQPALDRQGAGSNPASRSTQKQ